MPHTTNTYKIMPTTPSRKKKTCPSPQSDLQERYLCHDIPRPWTRVESSRLLWSPQNVAQKAQVPHVSLMTETQQISTCLTHQYHRSFVPFQALANDVKYWYTSWPVIWSISISWREGLTLVTISSWAGPLGAVNDALRPSCWTDSFTRGLTAVTGR